MHNACMPSITIRNVPQEVRDELAARAALSGRSLQEYLHGELVALSEKPDIDTLLAEIRRRKTKNPKYLSADKILEYIHEGRR